MTRTKLLSITMLLTLLMLSSSLINSTVVIGKTRAIKEIQTFGLIAQTATEKYTYEVNISDSNTQITETLEEKIICQSKNASEAINYAISNLVDGQSILFKAGLYRLNGTIYLETKNDITFYFENDAILFITNQMNSPAIHFYDCNNCKILNPTIDGNAINQAMPNYNEGVYFESCKNSYVYGGCIYNCAQFGFLAASWGSDNVGIENCKLFNNGWNGITLGGYSSNENYFYAINNEVAYSSDVGISTYANAVIRGNYVHDLNGTTGGGGNASWGIAVEGNGNAMIINNNITRLKIGICSAVGDKNILEFNNIYSFSDAGIIVVTSNNTVSSNQIYDFPWNGSWTFAVQVYGDHNNLTNNIINSNSETSMGFLVAQGAFLNKIQSNNVNVIDGAYYNLGNFTIMD